MATFAILTPTASPQIEAFRAAMVAVFPEGASFEFSPGQFVAVAPKLTSEEVGRKLGPIGEVGQFVVFTTAGSWGYHRKDLWEWLRAKGSGG